MGIFLLSSNGATKSPVFESKSLYFVRRNGKFTDFDLKKTLLRCLRAIFGALFPVLAGKKPPIFLTKGVFSCPFSESNTIFPPIPAIFANQTGVNTVKIQLSGQEVRKRRRNKAKQRYLPHNTDKISEWQTFLWKIQPLYCIFPPNQRGMWITFRLKSRFLSIIA